MSAGAAKTATVGAQSGTLTAGEAGTVTFPVTTQNIASGNYTVTVANRPTGVSVQGQVSISGNAGSLTLAGNTSTVAGVTNTLTLTIDGVTSAPFMLTVNPAGTPKTVEAKYRFNGGTWAGYGGVLGVANLTATAFTVTGGVTFSYAGVYTEGGGSNLAEAGDTWAYLYASTGKIGIVIRSSSGAIDVHLGKDQVSAVYNVLVTADMQNTHNGDAWLEP